MNMNKCNTNNAPLRMRNKPGDYNNDKKKLLFYTAIKSYRALLRMRDMSDDANSSSAAIASASPSFENSPHALHPTPRHRHGQAA